MSIEQVVQDIAALSAAEKMIATAKKARYADLQTQLKRGTVYAHSSDGVQLGYATVPKPSAPAPRINIEDEARVLPWALDVFGEEIATFRLTEQGRKSVIEYARIQHEAAGKPDQFDGVEGVTVVVPEPSPPAPRFTSDVKAMAAWGQALVRDGGLTLTQILEMGGAE